MPKNKTLEKLKKETKVYFSTSRGPGGQRRDKKKTGVRLHHLPTSMRISVDTQTSQAQNKKIAFQILIEKLKKLNQRKKKRIPTRIPRYVKEKRLQKKKYRSQIKRLRRNPIVLS